MLDCFRFRFPEQHNFLHTASRGTLGSSVLVSRHCCFIRHSCFWSHCNFPPQTDHLGGKWTQTLSPKTLTPTNLTLTTLAPVTSRLQAPIRPQQTTRSLFHSPRRALHCIYIWIHFFPHMTYVKHFVLLFIL